MATSSELPPDVVAAIADGRKIEAIKLLRNQWRISLPEAKSLVDAFELDVSNSAIHPPLTSDGELPDDVLAAIRAGNKLKAIKLLRQHRNLDLKAAKQIVDARFNVKPLYAKPRPQQPSNPLTTVAIAVVFAAISIGILYGVVPRICVAGMGGACVKDTE
ncbi:MAG: hypothetical protein AAF974_03110 [Cyanobacteria bacterium P01_E01_bin.34]